MPAGALVALGLALAAHADTGPPAEEDGDPQGTSPRQLLERTFSNAYGEDFVQKLSIESRGANGRGYTRRLQIVRKQSEHPGKALVRFLEPADVRGTSMLVIEREGRYDDLFLYLPAFAKVRRLSASQRGDAFFGTDIAYEDLEPRTAADFEVKAAGTSRVSNVPCVLLEVRPKTVESSYERTVSCVEPERGMTLSTEFYSAGRLVKRLEVDPASIRHIAGHWVPFAARIESALGSVTLLRVEAYEVRTNIPDALFTQRNLEMGSDSIDRAKIEELR